MLRSFCRGLPALLVCGWLAAPAVAQVEATFTKTTAVDPAYTLLPKADAVRRAVFSPDGLKVATVDARGVVRISAVKDTEKLWSFPARPDADKADATALTWSPNGKFVITGHADGTVRKIDANTGEKVWQVKKHDATVNDVATNRDADVVASASADKTVRLYDAQGEQTWISKLHADPVVSVDITNNGKIVLSADSHMALLCGAVNEPEKTTPLVLRKFPRADDQIIRVVLDPKTPLTDLLDIRNRGATVGEPGTDPLKLRLLIADKAGVSYYDLEKTKPMRRQKFADAVVDVALTPADKDSTQIAIVGTKKGTFAYRPDADADCYQLEFAAPMCVAIADDGHTALVGGTPDASADKYNGAVLVYKLN
jgi:hypothetical protein